MAFKSRMTPWALFKVLVLPCMFLCAIIKHPACQVIACIMLGIWCIYSLVSLIKPKRRKSNREVVVAERVNVKPDGKVEVAECEESKLSLLRQVNYRIMEQLKQTYPLVSWIWVVRPTPEEITKGCTRKIKLNNCDPFNFAEVTLTPSGKLSIALIQMVPLAEATTEVESDSDLSDEDILDRSDVKKWYTTRGEKILCELIDELNVQGHKRLVIHENGDVFVYAGDQKETVDTIPDFPPKPAWDDLCVLAREDEINVEVRGQELNVSWT